MSLLTCQKYPPKKCTCHVIWIGCTKLWFRTLANSVQTGYSPQTRNHRASSLTAKVEEKRRKKGKTEEKTSTARLSVSIFRFTHFRLYFLGFVLLHPPISVRGCLGVSTFFFYFNFFLLKIVNIEGLFHQKQKFLSPLAACTENIFSAS